MQDTIPQETPLDIARLTELVLDQGEAIAALTARAVTAERRTAALLGMIREAATRDAALRALGTPPGLPEPATALEERLAGLEATLASVVAIVTAAYKQDDLPVPDALVHRTRARQLAVFGRALVLSGGSAAGTW